jgi:hypothetical protein
MVLWEEMVKVSVTEKTRELPLQSAVDVDFEQELLR